MCGGGRVVVCGVGGGVSESVTKADSLRDFCEKDTVIVSHLSLTLTTQNVSDGDLRSPLPDLFSSRILSLAFTISIRCVRC